MIWRDLPIGRIMRAPARPTMATDLQHLRPGGGSGSGDDLDDCKRQFRAAWATLRAGLTDEDIAMALEMRQ